MGSGVQKLCSNRPPKFVGPTNFPSHYLDLLGQQNCLPIFHFVFLLSRNHPTPSVDPRLCLDLHGGGAPPSRAPPTPISRQRPSRARTISPPVRRPGSTGVAPTPSLVRRQDIRRFFPSTTGGKTSGGKIPGEAVLLPIYDRRQDIRRSAIPSHSMLLLCPSTPYLLQAAALSEFVDGNRKKEEGKG